MRIIKHFVRANQTRHPALSGDLRCQTWTRIDFARGFSSTRLHKWTFSDKAFRANLRTKTHAYQIHGKQYPVGPVEPAVAGIVPSALAFAPGNRAPELVNPAVEEGPEHLAPTLLS